MINKIALLDIFVNGEDIVESTGLGSLSAVLKQNGYETILAAYNEENIDYDKIYEFSPDVILAPINYDSISIIKDVFKKIKKELQHIIIISGGYLPTNNTTELLNDVEDVEYVIRGEGEVTIIELLSAISDNKECDNILGISYRKNGELVHNSERELILDLDELPFPDRSVMVQHNIPLVQVEGARGCPCRCTFCSVHRFWTNNNTNLIGNWRPKSVKRVVDEIEHIANNYNISRFRFLDCSIENPTLNIERINELADELISRNLNITYFVNVRADVYKIFDDILIKKLIKSGLASTFIGVESFEPEDLRVFCKNASEEDSYKTIELLQKYPLYVNIGMINFHPYSTINSLKKNAMILKKYNLASRLLFLRELTVFKGTPIYDRIKEDNLLFGDYDDITNYKFSDEKVEIISKFLKEKRAKENLIDTLDLYSTSHTHLLSHLKHYFNKSEDFKAIEVVNDYELKLNKTLNDFGDSFTYFILDILNLVEDKWDQNIAEASYEKHMNHEYLSNVVKTLERDNIILQKRLLKLNLKYKLHFKGMYHNI